MQNTCVLIIILCQSVLQSETGIYVIESEWTTMRTMNTGTGTTQREDSTVSSALLTTTDQHNTEETSNAQSTVTPSNPRMAISTSCPSGYTLSAGGFCFLVSTTAEVFKMAYYGCKNRGGQLCTILSSAKNADLVTALQIAGMADNVYIGASNIYNGEDWAWITDEDIEYSNWADGYPGAAGSTENCLVMSASRVWKWRSVKCEEPYHYACCEIQSSDD